MRRAPSPLRLSDGRTLTFDRVRVMGVLNVTPDSFSDGGLHATPAAAIARGRALLAAGADILDVGGESTRPGSASVDAAEQIRRVRPVIRALAAEPDALLSIDTTSAEVAAAALDAGAHMVNDISGFRFDPGMLPLIAARGVPCVAMHTGGRPDEMQRDPRYEDVVAEVIEHLRGRIEAASRAGVSPSQVVVDPGIGFGKTLEHNLALIGGLPALVGIGAPVLVGTSRKSFLGRITGRPVSERLMATAGSCAAAVILGAHLLRVHDVLELRDTILVAESIARAPRR